MTAEHKDLDYLKGKFEDGDRPTGEDFAHLIDSCHNTRQLTDVTITETLSVQGDLTVDGTINTRDVAADGSKLDSLDSFVRNNSDSWEETVDIQAVTTQLQTVSTTLSANITSVNETLSTRVDNDNDAINSRVDSVADDLTVTQDGLSDVVSTVNANSGAWEVDENVNTLAGLLDVDVSNTEHNDTLKYDINEQKWFAAPDLHGEGHHEDTFIELHDTPVAYTGANKFIKTSETNDGLVFVDLNTTDWDTAYGWGDHSAAGYLTSFTETDPIFTAHAAHGITTEKISDWDTAYGWGDHSVAGYLTSFTVTESDVTTHQNALHVTTTVATNSGNWAVLDNDGKLIESQIPELSITQTYTVQNPEEVATLNPAEGIQRGDIVIVTSSYDNLVAKQDNPTGTYNSSTKAYSGYSKLARPDAYVTSVNDMYGNVTISSDNIDDTDNTNKWVTQVDIDNWNDADNKFVNSTGDTMTGDLDTTANILSGGRDLSNVFWVKGEDLGTIGNYDIQGEITADGFATKNTAGDPVVGITQDVNVGGNILHIVNGIIVGVTDEA